jgi:hypothetical protein
MHPFSARKIYRLCINRVIKKPFSLIFLAGVFLIFLFLGWGIGKTIHYQKLILIKKQEEKIKQQEVALMNKLINKVKNKTNL